jgi:hypothetical protein
VFAAACIGDLPDAIESRAIIVPMRRRTPDEVVQPFGHRKVEAQVGDLRRRLAQLAVRSLDQLKYSEPAMPVCVIDRAADCWEPLVAVADIVAGRVADDQSTGVRLLADIHALIFGNISSADLCQRLNALEESGWGGSNEGKGMHQRDLARRLKPYGLQPKNIRLPEGHVA